MIRNKRYSAAFLAAVFLAVPLAMAEMLDAASEKKTPTAIELRIQDGKIAGGRRTVRVTQGENVLLRWKTDHTTTIHLHGYDIEKKIQKDAPTEMRFHAKAAGRFAVTVHGHGGGHGKEKTLIYLEVYPR